MKGERMPVDLQKNNHKRSSHWFWESYKEVWKAGAVIWAVTGGFHALFAIFGAPRYWSGLSAVVLNCLVFVAGWRLYGGRKPTVIITVKVILWAEGGYLSVYFLTLYYFKF